MAETQALTNMMQDVTSDIATVKADIAIIKDDIDDMTSDISDIKDDIDNMNSYDNGLVYMVYSDHGVRTTVSSTRHDTAGRGVNRIYFVTDGALTTVSDTGGYIALSTAIDSGTTMTAGSYLLVRDSKKVVCSSHGVQQLFFNP